MLRRQNKISNLACDNNDNISKAPSVYDLTF